MADIKNTHHNESNKGIGYYIDRIAGQRERACGFLGLRCGESRDNSGEQVKHALDDIYVASHF